MKNIIAIALLWIVSMPLFSQFSTCDTNLINAHLNPAGFTRLYVPSEPCSMYFYNPTPVYGITAHLDAVNLGVPQLVVNDSAENYAVENALYAQGVFPGNYQVWMGITDSAVLYTWKTFSGAPAPAYTNWASGEPNNQAPSCQFLGACTFCSGADVYWCAHGEDCAVLNDAGKWLDITCEGANVTRIAVLELNTCPVLTKPRDTAICSGNPLNLNATVSSGGTTPYTYTWNPGGYTGQTLTINPTGSATYTVEASDKYLCKTDSTFTVSVTSTTPPTINLTQSTVCKGANNTVSLSTISGTATYTWSFGAGANVVSGSGGGPYTVNWLSGGSKSINVTVSDHGCTTNATTTVTIDSASAAFTLNPLFACTNQDITVTVSHPSVTATYSWNFSGANIVNGSGVGPYSINWPSAGAETITLSVTDNGCASTDTQSINIGNYVTANAGPDIQLCPGLTDTLGATPNPNYTYLWSPAWGLSSTTIANPTISFASNTGSSAIDTFYILTASLGTCSSSDTVRVTIYPSINNNFTIARTGICVNDGLLVTYSGTVNHANTYNWSFNADMVDSTNAPAQYILTWASPGVDTITLSVTGNGCSDTSVSKVVTVYSMPFPSIMVSNHDSLYTGTFAAYQWLLNRQPIPGANAQSYVALTTGSYQVVATDSAGCSDTSELYTVRGVGVTNVSGDGRVRIYPNPSNGSFIVETNNANGGEISISDILGRMVMKQAITMDKQQINMSNAAIASGEYLVTIRIDGQLYTTKITLAKE